MISFIHMGELEYSNLRAEVYTVHLGCKKNSREADPYSSYSLMGRFEGLSIARPGFYCGECSGTEIKLNVR